LVSEPAATATSGETELLNTIAPFCGSSGAGDGLFEHPPSRRMRRLAADRSIGLFIL
jgi:hypothetical protein